MISFTVRMQFEESDRAAVVGLVRHLGPASRQEPGCVNYVAHWVEGETATVLIYEQYADEAALEFHRKTPHFERYATGLYQIMRSRQIENLNALD